MKVQDKKKVTLTVCNIILTDPFYCNMYRMAIMVKNNKFNSAWLNLSLNDVVYTQHMYDLILFHAVLVLMYLKCSSCFSYSLSFILLHVQNWQHHYFNLLNS